MIFLRKLLNYKQITVYIVNHCDTLQCVPVGVILCGGVLPRSMTQCVTFKGMKSVGMKYGWDEIWMG